MSKQPVLVVLAAGMGSRYGGLKQIDPMGSHGEAILDYSVYDAWQAGFKTVVIIIKEAIREDFMQTVGKRLEKAPVEIRYAYQELSMLPKGYTVPDGRTKPWGTTHAVLCAKEAIGDAPFAVINADDYYGPNAYRAMYDFLSGSRRAGECCMIGYLLGNTVTDHGAVTRGICRVDEAGYLTGITECTGLEKTPEGIRHVVGDESSRVLSPDTVVSMNMWGFGPDFPDRAAEGFPGFLDLTMKENPLKGEYFLPMVVEQLLEERAVSVKVLPSADQWYGVTYAADKPMVVAALRAMTAEGKYPDGLWVGKAENSIDN